MSRQVVLFRCLGTDQVWGPVRPSYRFDKLSAAALSMPLPTYCKLNMEACFLDEPGALSTLFRGEGRSELS